MELFVLTVPDDMKGEHDILLSLFEEGLPVLHVRKPGYGREQYENWISCIPEKYHKCLVLHNYWDLANKYAVKGIHGCSEDFPVKNRSRSCSCHSFNELLQLTHNYDYCFLSPVFNSISKKGYRAAFSHSDLSKFLMHYGSRISVVALGGIDEANIMQVREMGFDGAAVLGALWENSGRDAVVNFNKMREILCKTPVC
ncbi:MAG: thiamine phosphate synthase [Fibrobacteria bacterium]|nr:thiamine phosphate synthase [Fibrobacteria bacterium]